MTSFPLMLSSLSCCFPKSSVLFLDLRPPPAPPPESPSPPTPPEPPDPPDPQISHSPGKANAQPFILLHLTGPPQRAHCDFEPPSLLPSRHVPPCRMSIPLSIAKLAPRQSSRRRRHMLHIPCSSKVNLGFYYLGHKGVDCLLGLKSVAGLLGQKLRVFFFVLGTMGPTPSPLFTLNRVVSCLISMIHLKPFQPIVTRLLSSFAVSKNVCSFAGSVTIPPIPFPQVCSCYSLSDSSILGSYWMTVDSVALALWNLDIPLTPSMSLDTLGSKFMLFSGTPIVLVRNFTAVCRFYFELALLEVSLSQIGKRSLLSFTVPVILVHRGSYSPHLSFKELIILPNTSLVSSGIVIGSIVVKPVLLGVEAWIVVQGSSRSAIADWLTLEALFPSPCGFDKDFRFGYVCHIDGHCFVSTLAPLSFSFCLSFDAVFSLLSYSITLLVVVFDVSASYCLVVSFLSGG